MSSSLNFSPAKLTQLHLDGQTNVQGQCQTLGNAEQLDKASLWLGEQLLSSLPAFQPVLCLGSYF